ncbi:polysaccharide deacetylase family protein [Catellatospora tritici]|uniref:polysaccharide deacetylase family protein n=1 Tax=Catellatospora tritici TaxID=2851566 RepID=UPI0027DF01CA|nr:polysaccharide deacetylase family protein [Catellatospora tritici]
MRRLVGTLVAAVVGVAAAGCRVDPVQPWTAPTPSPSPVAVTAGPTAAASPSAGPSPVASPKALPGQTRAGLLPPVVEHGSRKEHRVALTFDADMTDDMLRRLARGKATSYTNLRVLDLLERERVPATFFLTGKWVRQYPEVTARLAANPRFELANHTYGHQAFTADCYGLPQIKPAQMTADVAKTFQLISGYGGRQTRYFRFPGLCHDHTALRAMAPLGLTVVDGDVVSGDPFAADWRPIVAAVKKRVQPGSIVIMHITEDNARFTDEALPHILDLLRERQLRPVTVSELLGR